MNQRCQIEGFGDPAGYQEAILIERGIDDMKARTGIKGGGTMFSQISAPCEIAGHIDLIGSDKGDDKAQKDNDEKKRDEPFLPVIVILS